MFKPNKKARETFKKYSKLTRTTPEQRLTLLLLILNIFCTLFYYYYCWIQTTKCRLGLRNYSFRQSSCFQNCQKSIFLWAEKICWAKYFHPYSKLRKNKFSRQRLKKISQTLNWKLVMAYCMLHLNNDVKTNNDNKDEQRSAW